MTKADASKYPHASDMQDEPDIVPLRCIQTEETAMKELSELYGAQASAAPQPAARESVPPSGQKPSRPRSRRSDTRKDDNRKGERRRSSGKSKVASLEKGPKQAPKRQVPGEQTKGPRREGRKQSLPAATPGRERDIKLDSSLAHAQRDLLN